VPNDFAVVDARSEMILFFGVINDFQRVMLD
jgi:hypothetical protein